MKISQLAPQPENPRKVTPEKLAQLKKTLLEFGDLSGVVFNLQTQHLVGGHRRVENLQDAEITYSKRYDKPTKTGTVAEGYIVSDGERFAYREVRWPLVREKAANIAANKNAGEWDLPQLEIWLKELNSFDVSFDMDLTMFDEEELAAIIGTTVKEHTRVGPTGADEDDVPEKAPARAKLGDVYRLGRHRLMCGDSTKKDDVRKLMKGAKADLTVTDPPYNVNYGADNSKHPSWAKKNRTILNDCMPPAEFRAFCVLWIKSIAEASEGCIYVWGPSGPDGRIIFSELDQAFHCSTVGVWVKDRLVLGRGKYHSRYEPCWFGWNTNGSSFSDDRSLTNVWEFPRPSKSDLHPTMKPVELIQKLLEDAGGERVLDLFGGSGTTIIACEKTDRDCFMMELDPHYVDVIIERWEKYTGKEAKRVASIKSAVKAKPAKAAASPFKGASL